MLMFATILTLALGTYLAALVLALQTKRRAALAERLEARGTPERAEWVIRQRGSMLMTLSFLRACCRVGFFALVLVDVVGVGEGAVLEVRGLLIAGAVSVVCIWLFTTVLALALAEHAGVGMIIGALPMLRLAAWVGRPASRILSFVDEAVRRLSGATPRPDEAEAELLRSIEDTHLEGALEPQAAAMLENVVEFRSTEVSEIMTPRTDIEGIEMTDDLVTIRAFIRKAGHSRIPVYQGSLDHIVGILYVKDLVRYLGEEPENFSLTPLLRKPIIVPETKPVAELLSDFQRSEVHLAIVIDEYGGTSGLVTIEDVLEEIVGEIHDEHEPESDQLPTLTVLDERHAEADGRFYIYDLNERLGLTLPEDDDFDTLAGFLLAQAGRVPETGEVIETPQVRFKVLSASRTHVKRVAIELLTSAPETVPPGNGDAGPK
ncbi:MAG: HlyC/CorC family transporter [Phycisphaeraceae bacterium]|nr:hemolysin family protein [Phycisphaerales bacterium]QOJ17814.1 MAG: HlyC/CorC family transporter [Phycisphaeraceae bacterium]